MSEKELGRALLDLDSQKLAGVPPTREQTWRILDADRRRVWRWTALTITLWTAAILMVLLMLVAYGLVFPLQAKLRQDAEVARLGISPEQVAEAQFQAQVIFQMITVGVTASVGLTCFAILSSFFLGRVSRQATLRQINASLLEISNQLKELRLSTTPPTKPQ